MCKACVAYYSVGYIMILNLLFGEENIQKDEEEKVV